MKSVSLAERRHLAGTPRPGMFTSLACRLVLRQMEKLEAGSLTLIDGDDVMHFGQPEETSGLSAKIRVTDSSFYSDIAFGGSIGAGESYMQGSWRCDDLVSLVRILLRNRHVLDDMETGTARFSRPFQKLFHFINRNTREGARRNISAHYDLGNDFFSLWLDKSMMYSSAIFNDQSMTLHEAQMNRLEVICNRLELGPEDHLVEIGTGWGSLAVFAAGRYGCKVTTTTISAEQKEWAERQVKEAGLEDRITVLLDDYRDLEGRYDKLVSVEMIEAIGAAQYNEYFRKCSELLKPGGLMLIQAITIADKQYEYARKNVDFIQRYIFPGACLPSLSVMMGTIANVTDMLVTGVDDIGRDYALTLNHWRQRFFAKIEEVRALGYPEEFIRMWEFYLCYCEGGFIERSISDVHLVAEKPAY